MQYDCLVPCDNVRLYLKQPQADEYPDRPLILLIHGALANHKHLLRWSQLWSQEFDVRLVDLPGHGRSEAPLQATFAAFVVAIHHLVGQHLAPRPVIVVGESLGGLIALALGNAPPANLIAVAALGPPFSTAGLWPMTDQLRQELSLQPDNAFLRDFAFQVFGVSSDTDVVQDRLYAAWLTHLAIPALVLAGDRPLGERRVLSSIPSLIAETDRDLLRTRVSDRFKFGVISDTGHLITARHPRATFEAVRGFIGSMPLVP